MNGDIPKYNPMGIKGKLEALEQQLAEMQGGVSAPKRSFKDIMLGRGSVEKEFKLPRKVRSKKKLEKQNYAIGIILKTNGSADIVLCPIVDDLAYVKQFDNSYVVGANYVFRYKKYPLIVIPEWNMEAISHKPKPFSPEEDLENIANGSADLSYPRKVMVNNLAKVASEMKDKKTMGMNWLWILIGVGVVLYFITKLIGK